MTDHIVNRWPHFSNFLNLFKAKLTKPAQRHLLALLIALIIYDGRKNVAGLNRALFAPRHPSSLNRFLSEAKWDEADLEQTRQVELNRRIRHYLASHQAKGVKAPAFLCIDDTHNPKSGTRTPYASFQYNHLAGGLVRCYCLVTALVVIGPYTVPLALQLYRKQEDCLKQGRSKDYVSKTEVAVRLIREWQPPDHTQPFVLVDSWYVCQEVIAECDKRGFTLIGGLKANRCITPKPNARLLKLSEYAPSLPQMAYQLVTLEKQRVRVGGVKAFLKGGRAIKLVISRQIAPGTSSKAGIKQYNYRFFFSTEPAMSTQSLCEFYSVRWEIETFHANIKELLGLDHNQAWCERSVRRQWCLLLLAYTYLALEAAEHYAVYGGENSLRVSIGQVVNWHKREAHRGQIEWVYQKAKADLPLAELLKCIAA
jgi:SRSO17 transposase